MTHIDAPAEILSVAVWEPVTGHEAESLATLRELSSILAAKGYGRDHLYRDRESHYLLLRYWKSEESRRAAQEDPDMLRCWARLGNQIQIVKVYETLAEVPRDPTEKDTTK
jgi:heme-degrading monooxygenase HmoA